VPPFFIGDLRFEISDFADVGIWAGKDQKGKQWDENCSAGAGYAYQVSVDARVCGPEWKIPCG